MHTKFFIIISSILLTIFWPWFASFRGAWKNEALRRDNPHLQKCYRIRRWLTPFIFLTAQTSLMIFLSHSPMEWSDEIMLTVLVMFVSLFTGMLLSELLVDYFRQRPQEERF